MSHIRPAAKICITYVLLWIFPLALTWIVALFGYEFSFVGRNWQARNILRVGCLTGFAILIGLGSGLLFLRFCSRYFMGSGLTNSQVEELPLSKSTTRIEIVFSMALAALSLVGLYRSFGGSIFEKSYSGANAVWLNYGAWSITFLICLGFIFGEYRFKTRQNSILVLVIITLCFLPVLLCGSRIDFLSFMIAVAISTYYLSNEAFYIRLTQAFSIIAWCVLISLLVAKFRYFYGSTDLWQSADGVSLKSSQVIMTLNPVHFLGQGKFLYLSTIGDLGASVFQIIGLIDNHEMSFVGLDTFFRSYFLRLMPGFTMSNRPGDFTSFSPESIGGGALHAIGEGYLVFGFLGGMAVSACFGVMGAISGIFGERFKHSPSAVSWLLFAFPWLILIRGGWYQFFAVFKSVEVLLLFLLLLILLKKLARYVRAGSGGNRAWH